MQNNDESSTENSNLKMAALPVFQERKNRASYLREREKIKSEIGDLEQIRLKLGLSRRKMCQLLLIDPSAWTRWTQSDAPPHVYQALKWLLQLITKGELVFGPFDIERKIDTVHASVDEKIKALENHVSTLERILATQSTVQPIVDRGNDNSSLALQALTEQYQMKVLKIEGDLQALAQNLVSNPKRNPTKFRVPRRAKLEVKRKTKSRGKKRAASTRSKKSAPKRNAKLSKNFRKRKKNIKKSGAKATKKSKG